MYYDVLVDDNNNVPNLETNANDEFDEEQRWIRMYLVRGDLIIIPKERVFRLSTTGTVSQS